MTTPELRIAPDGRVATRTHRLADRDEWAVVAGPDASWLTRPRPTAAEVETWTLLVPAVSPAPDTEALREGRLWSVLDWSLWGNGLGDVLRSAMADVMVAALTPEQREQAEACIKSWHERRSPSMAVGVGTQLQRERDEALAEVDRLKSYLLGRRNNLAQLLGQPASEEDTGWYGLCAQVQEREAGLRADLDQARAERNALSRMLRDMARRVGEVRDEMRFATVHIDQWQKVAQRLRSQRDNARASGARTIPDDAAPLVSQWLLDHTGNYADYHESRPAALSLIEFVNTHSAPTTDPAPAAADQPMPADEKPILAHTTGLQGVVERAALRCCDVDRRNWNLVSEADRDRYRQYGMAMFRALPPHIAGQMSAAPQAPAEPTECKEQAGSVQSGAEIESPAAREDAATPEAAPHDVEVTVQDDGWATAECRTCAAHIGESTEDTVSDWADQHRADTLRPSGPLAPIRHEEE